MRRMVTADMDWIYWAAIASGVGGIATAGALFVSLGLLRQQMGELRQARLDRRRNHASSIAFWIELGEVDDTHGTVFMRAHVQNTSNQPVINVEMQAGVRGDVWAEATAQDSADYPEVINRWDAVAVGPEDKLTLDRSLEGLPPSVMRRVASIGDSTLIGELHFTDASAVEWIRTARGLLVERLDARWMKVQFQPLGKRDEMLRPARFRMTQPIPEEAEWLRRAIPPPADHSTRA